MRTDSGEGRSILTLLREQSKSVHENPYNAPVTGDMGMAIDKPREVFGNIYYPDEENKSPLELVIFGSKLALPKAAIPLELFQTVYNRLTGISIGKRMTETWKFLINEFDRIDDLKVDKADFQEAIQVVLRRDAEQFNDKKRERYVKLIGNAARSEEQINDVSSFIETIEQLNERDMTVLKVINQIMNKEGDWKPQHNPAGAAVWKVHPNTFIQRAQELSVQIGIALGQKTERNTYTREEGYGIGNRLQGFGLVHEVEVQTRELPLTNYAFRPSVQGIRLLKLLGETVPNYEYYFKEY
jgi:hypothetical protein